MKNKITIYLLIAIFLANTVFAEKFFALDVFNIQGSLTFNSISLREISNVIKYDDKSGFLIKTVSLDGSDIQKIYYNMSESKNYIVYMPYDKNAAKILVYDSKNSVVMEVDTSSFADTCSNKVCEPYESYENCPQDCKSGAKDGFCDGAKDGICDPDCPARLDADCNGVLKNETSQNQTAIQNTNNQQQNQIIAEQPKQNSNYLLWFMLIIGAAVSALIFFFIKKIKENKIIGSLKQYIGENIQKGFTLSQIKDTLFRAGYKEKEINKAIKSI